MKMQAALGIPAAREDQLLPYIYLYDYDSLDLEPKNMNKLSQKLYSKKLLHSSEQTLCLSGVSAILIIRG